ncbi:MAG: SIS domain-containing protein [Magnetococcales bacterium]|nr:SIS domain-containing protein [Magnetococcales bacterium]
MEESLLSLESHGRRLQSLIEGAAFSDREGHPLDHAAGMSRALAMLEATRATHRLYLIGNGGSAGIASHIGNDLLKVARLRAMTLHDPSQFSCLANDYGYERVFSAALEVAALPGDVLIALSSSGRSPNILNAAEEARRRACPVFTLSGFTPDNPLRRAGDLNLWVDAANYGLVEIAHFFVLHVLAERLNPAG